MALENFCGPALLYLGFSLIQIIIDLYKGLYNTTFIKFLVMVLFTVFLNILCKSGLTIISWFIVFIPFISMTIITTLLLFVFGLNPASGKYNYDIIDFTNNFSYNNTGMWKLTYADGTSDFISVNNGYYTLNNQEYRLLNTTPITIRWPDGTIQTLDNVNENGVVRWTTNHSLQKYNYIIWESTDHNQMENLEPCPPNMSAGDYNKYYGGYCASKNVLDQFHYNSSGSFRVTYYDGDEEIISLNNGRYTINNSNYRLLDTTPITIEWPDGTIQTLDVIDNDGFVRWRTNSNVNKYSYIIWEPLNNRLNNPFAAPISDNLNNPFTALISDNLNNPFTAPISDNLNNPLNRALNN